MKKILAFVLALVSMASVVGVTMGSCARNNQKECKEEGALVELKSLFGDSTVFATLEMGGRTVLLVSDETYFNEDENQQPIRTAVAAQAFGLNEKGKVVCYGELRSQGTLYPLSYADGMLMAAGHQFVKQYTMGEDNTFDLQLNYEPEQYDEMIAQFEAAKPVVFSR